MTEPLLVVTGLGIEIEGREIISSVDFELPRGQCMGLVGETGSGKSLTCRAVTGMLGWLGARTTRGKVVFDGVDTGTLDRRGWARLRGFRIGFIPQNSLSGLDPVMSVGSQIRETITHLRGERPSRADVVDLLRQVQMPHADSIYHAYPHELSGGMRQRVMIALGMAGQPELLVADEATTALDVTVQREILDLLTDLRQQSGMAMIVVSHDLDIVSDISDRVAIMYAGMTVEAGPTRRVLSEPHHPYTRALLGSRPSALGVGQRLLAIPGNPPDPREWPAGCRFAPRCPMATEECIVTAPRLRRDDDREVRCLRADEVAAVGAQGWV
jgi:oligopeptide/dipeptide ABC transporter ATP-binding protein